ncbi:MAG: hypothetical protein EA428_15265, partial [Spirochaetaceae bacterium]
MPIHRESVVLQSIPDYNRRMRAERLQRILYLFVAFGVLGVSSVGAQGAEQSFVLRSLSQPETPVDYDIGSLITVDSATRALIEDALVHI